MRHFACILTVLMCISIYSSTSNASTPPKPKRPDKTAFDNARDYYQVWRTETIPQVVTNVRTKFNAAMSIVNDLKNADAAVRNTMYAALPASIKNNMVSAAGSAYGLTVKLATNWAKTKTLESAALEVFGVHETKLNTFNNLWDENGTVTYDYVTDLIAIELTDGSNPGGQANSLMEAFYRMEYAGGVYNLEVQAWNAWYKKYAPSQYDSEKRDEVTITDPLKPTFTQIGCFNHCGDRFDTFSDAESSHKEECGSADNVDIESAQSSRGGAIPRSTWEILSTRNVSQGCGRSYYDCPRKPAGDEHDVLTCKKDVWEEPEYYGGPRTSYRCNRSFRRCMGHTFDHDPRALGESAHSDEAGGSSGGDQTAQVVDNTLNCDLCTDGCSSCQSTSPPTASMETGACGLHSTDNPTDAWRLAHSWATFSCQDDTHVGYLCQEPSEHSNLIASCTETDSNGNTCTVASYYECQSHTHVYPAPEPEQAAQTCGTDAQFGASGCGGEIGETWWIHSVDYCSHCYNWLRRCTASRCSSSNSENGKHSFQ